MDILILITRWLTLLPLNVEAWVLACNHFGFDVPTFELEDELKKGAPSEQIIERIGIKEDKVNEVIKLKRSLFRDNALRELRLYPDVEETFLKLKKRGNLITILSMMPDAIIEETLKRAQLSECVDKVVGVDTLPDKYNKTSIKLKATEIIMEHIPVNKNRFIIVGDSQEENEVSRQFGFRYIHFPRFTTQTSVEGHLEIHKRIHTLIEILN